MQVGCNITQHNAKMTTYELTTIPKDDEGLNYVELLMLRHNIIPGDILAISALHGDEILLRGTICKVLHRIATETSPSNTTVYFADKVLGS